MTTLTWIYVVGGVVMSIIALIGFFGLRAKRAELTRKSLPFFVGGCVSSMIPMFFFFRGVVALFYFIVVAVIYIPIIVHLLKLPKDDHVA
jgi:hypothetical protein